MLFINMFADIGYISANIGAVLALECIHHAQSFYGSRAIRLRRHIIEV
jgi:hypothetical protein